MRFLHTSDWHIGRNVRSQSRLAEHEAVLQEVLSPFIRKATAHNLTLLSAALSPAPFCR